MQVAVCPEDTTPSQFQRKMRPQSKPCEKCGLGYAVDNDLYAAAFDRRTLKASSDQILRFRGVLRSLGSPQYAVSDSGTLAFILGITGTSAPIKIAP